MKTPSPASGLLSTAGWIAATALATPLLLPPVPAYRTAVVAVSVLLFAIALAAPRAGFVAATCAVAASGFSALAFGLGEPVAAGAIPAGGYFAGAALRSIYEIRASLPAAPLLPLWRGLLAAGALAAAVTWVHARTAYLLFRGVPSPRTVNVLGHDDTQAVGGAVAALAALAVAAGFHRNARALSATAAGRRAVDLGLVAPALAAGGVALLQKLGALPLLRADRWAEASRAQATFTDPSAAGVAAALLLAPLLSRVFGGGRWTRWGALAGALLLLPVLADAGSRAGFLGGVTAVVLLALWGLTRLAAGARAGARRRVSVTVGAAALLLAVAFAAALAWPVPGSARSVLLARLEGSLSGASAPSERAAERLVLYEAGLVMFRERPVAGGGLGSFRAEYPNVAAEALGRPTAGSDHPPSLYLGVLVEQGLAGALLLALFLVGLVRGLLAAFAFGSGPPEEALRAAGAGAALAGLLVVFLFGSHVVYPEVAALAGLLTARLEVPPEGRTARLLSAQGPMVTAGALVLLLGGVVARAYETWGPEAAFSRGTTAGVWGTEREPDGRPFRWTGTSAAFLRPGRSGPATLLLPVKNARPDLEPVSVAVLWNDRPAGSISLPAGRWLTLSQRVEGPGVLRLVPARTFRPPGRGDVRRLGVEVGELSERP